MTLGLKPVHSKLQVYSGQLLLKHISVKGHIFSTPAPIGTHQCCISNVVDTCISWCFCMYTSHQYWLWFQKGIQKLVISRLSITVSYKRWRARITETFSRWYKPRIAHQYYSCITAVCKQGLVSTH